jgi:hypothetical protein
MEKIKEHGGIAKMITFWQKLLDCEPESKTPIDTQEPVTIHQIKKQYVWTNELKHLPAYIHRSDTTNTMLNQLHWELQENNNLHTLLWGSKIVGVIKRTDFGYVWQADLNLVLPNKETEWLTQDLETTASLTECKELVHRIISSAIEEHFMNDSHYQYETHNWIVEYRLDKLDKQIELRQQKTDEQATRIREKLADVRKRRQVSRRRCNC